ncbi:hypothetical protein PFICI_05740 [Pestalotiopsis fici W106-1]|uniref:Uncharacterized protein n=1 Tax=Pestalotiopsis fici (strain W106-1 / CGMCC3.15140) TaxID=1229662 RepID=W3XCX6_PESFW|nr:uncharacterized protein PFICI_05740 [Pestalotiopsis fici W106-1]ETS83864.1 hypothetical protein PFICI_05740 [Pestalotiopsis fici W106-1]
MRTVDDYPGAEERLLVDDDEKPKNARNARSWKTRHLPIVFTFLCTSLFWLLAFWLQPHFTSQNSISTTTLNCGNSTAEARALGCVYDPLSVVWIPEPCFDKEITEAYQEAADWVGSNDWQGKEMLDLDAMSERVAPLGYFTSIRDHVVHCAYAWLRQHRGYLRGGLYLDDDSLEFSHTQHCAEVLVRALDLDVDALEQRTTKAFVGFSSCEVETGLTPLARDRTASADGYR